MIFAARQRPLSRQDQLLTMPIRLVDPEITASADGGAKLKVALKQSPLARWFLKIPTAPTKTFELDPIGVFVWDSMDGKTNVRQIIQKLSRQYGISVREAEVSTFAFLQTLTGKGLIGMQMRRRAAGGMDGAP
jgi:hypothetical protein